MPTRNPLNDLVELTKDQFDSHVYIPLPNAKSPRISGTNPGIKNVILEGSTDSGTQIAFIVELNDRYDAIREFENGMDHVPFEMVASNSPSRNRYFLISVTDKNIIQDTWELPVDFSGPGGGNNGNWLFVKSKVTEDELKK